MPTVIQNLLPRPLYGIRYCSETGDIISNNAFSAVTVGTFLVQHTGYINSDISIIHFYGLGTYMDKCGKFHNKNKLIFYPFTVFIWRKNFIAHGWIKGHVLLFIRRTYARIHRGESVLYDKWELIRQFHGTGEVITLLRKANWKKAVNLITNDDKDRQAILKAMMEE